MTPYTSWHFKVIDLICLYNYSYHPMRQPLFWQRLPLLWSTIANEKLVWMPQILCHSQITLQGSHWTEKLSMITILCSSHCRIKSSQLDRLVLKQCRHSFWKKRRVRPQCHHWFICIPMYTGFTDWQCMELTNTFSWCYSQNKCCFPRNPLQITLLHRFKRVLCKWF